MVQHEVPDLCKIFPVYHIDFGFGGDWPPVAAWRSPQATMLIDFVLLIWQRLSVFDGEAINISA